MPLVDLIIQDLHKKINDSVLGEDQVESDSFTSQVEAYRVGARDAAEGAELYLREIFPKE